MNTMKDGAKGVSRAQRKSKPLPANLPPLPKVPAGYDAWEYMGMGWDNGGRSCLYACCAVEWDMWSVTPTISHTPSGTAHFHYIRAVKRPAKASAAKKPKTPERKAGRVVAKLERCSKDSGKGYYVVADRFVLPADAASVERMVEQAHDAFLEHASFRDGIRAALAAIGIAATGKGARK